MSLKMWIDSVIEYDIIIETLTGTEIEVTVTDDDTIGYIKTHIQKYEGIPIRQQHLIYNQRELSDATEVKDVPLSHGSRLKLVLGMKGGPVSAQRRLVKMPDLDTWFDLNAARQDQFTISSPGVKLLVYKDCKKNVHRVKLKTDRKSATNADTENALNLSVDVDDQFLKDNLNTMEKMHQLRTQLELKKRDKGSKLFCKFGTKSKIGNCDGESIFPVNGIQPNGKNVAVVNDGTTVDGNIEAGTSKAMRKYSRRIYLPPLKGFIDNATSLKKNYLSETEGLSMTDSNVLSSKNQAQITSNRPTSTDSGRLELLMRTHEPNWSTLIHETAKTKRKPTKSNWIQNFMEIIKTSKVPLSPSEIVDIKESMNKEGHASTQTDSIDEKQTQLESILSNISIDDSRCSKYMLNPISKSKSGQYFKSNQSDNSSETNVSNRSGSVSSLRSYCSNNGMPLLDLKYPIESDRLYSRRKASPKFPTNGLDTIPSMEKQTIHQFGTSRDEPKPYSNEFPKFRTDWDSTSNFGPAAAKAIADSSSFRVYKMTSDEKNYDLPKLLVREGSPVESFQSSDTQLETLTLRCDSPKSVLAAPDSTLDISGGAMSAKSVPVQINTVLTATADIIEPAAIDESPELDNLLYDRGGALQHLAAVDPVSSLIRNKNSNDDNCELLHNAKASMGQLNSLRTVFGSSPLLNYNSVATKSYCLENIPLKYRRGQNNLTDVCLSSSTSSIKDILCSNRYNNERLRTASKSPANTNNIAISSGNSISQEMFSFLRNRNNAPADYVRSYENLDRTKIFRLKNEHKRAFGNTNYGYADGDLVPNYLNRSQISGASSTSSNNSQNWQYGKSSEDEMKEDDDYARHSYSNLAYDNAEMGKLATHWTSEQQNSQSNESLFNINFDSTDDDTFQIESLNLLSVMDFPNKDYRDRGEKAHSMNRSERYMKTNSIKKSTVASEMGGLINLNDSDLLKFESNKVQYDDLTNTNKLHRNADQHRQSERTLNQLQCGAEARQLVDFAVAQRSIVTSSEAVSSSMKKPRCAECNKKLGIIMVMQCHCGKVFCTKHRYAEAHNCSYDFKTEAKKTIAKENPHIVASKVTKI